jgi:hypothetical protein
MSAQRSPYFWLARICLWVAVIAALPVVSLFLSYAIGAPLGCVVNESGASPCPFMGIDLGEMLLTMMILGWLGLITLPVGCVALTVWLVAWIGQRLWRHRQPGQSSA